MATLPDSWEYVAVGSCWVECSKSKEQTQDWCRAHKSLCGHAYILRDATVAQKLIEVGNTEIAQISDHIWVNLVANGSMATYVL